MTDFIIAAVLVFIVGAAVFYIYKAKKSGKKCIGCPDACSCDYKKKDSDCRCSSKTE